MFLNYFESLLEFMIIYLPTNIKRIISKDKNNLDLALNKTKNLHDKCNKDIFNS